MIWSITSSSSSHSPLVHCCSSLGKWGKVLLKFRLNKVLSKIFQTPRSVVCDRERKWTFFFPGAFKYWPVSSSSIELAAKITLAVVKLPPELRKQPREDFSKYQLSYVVWCTLILTCLTAFACNM